MKKIMFWAVLAAYAGSSYAQLDNRPFIGGNVSFYAFNQDSEYDETGTQPYRSDQNRKDFSFRIFPSAGYFFTENFAAGGSVGYTWTNSETNHKTNSSSSSYVTHSKGNSNQFSLMPFVRYNKFIVSKLSVFAQAEVAFSLGKGEGTSKAIIDGVDVSGPSKTKSNFYSIGAALRPGLVLFVTEKIGVEAAFGSLGYTYSVNESESEYGKDKSTNSGVQANFSLSSFQIGMKYYFGKSESNTM